MPSSTSPSFSTDLCFDLRNLSSITHKRTSGRKKFKETRHPIYRGVRQRNGEKWVCEMRLNNSNSKSRLWLGTHISPEMAARAYDIAAMALKGKSAQLNFPDSAWLLTLAKSSSVKDIQSAALVAAHPFRPTSKSFSTSVSLGLPFSESLETLLQTSAPLFFDEEAMFNMPCLIANMAEGLLLMPPPMHQESNSDTDDMHSDYNMDFSLWT